MWKRLHGYSSRIERLLAEPERVDWALVLEEHRDQIGFFQHERLIHLLVTLAFPLFTLLCLIAAIALSQPAFLLLAGLSFVLLPPYLIHYYHLENGIQRLYSQYDRIRAFQAGEIQVGSPGLGGAEG